MFNSFRVKFCHSFRDTNSAQKSHYCLMPLAAFFGQLPSALGEKDGAIGLGADVTVPHQPGDSSVDGHMGHSEPPRQIHHSRLSH